MVGGSGRDETYSGLKSTNLFAALQSRRKSKGKSKAKDGSTDKTEKKEEPTQYWAPTQVTVKSWADCDEDDDDYYATSVPPPPTWGMEAGAGGNSAGDENKEGLSQGEDSEGEEAEDYAEDEPEEEADEETPASLADNAAIARTSSVVLPREPERQLSKKELKKKELEELDAVLAELGLAKQAPEVEEDSSTKGDVGRANGSSANGHHDAADAKEESKTAKKKRAKKDKGKEVAPSEVTDPEPQPAAEPELSGPPADPKEMLKRIASAKKKKVAGKDDAQAKAKLAAAEAAARNAKLAAAKKKEKSHYNQQPVR